LEKEKRRERGNPNHGPAQGDAGKYMNGGDGRSAEPQEKMKVLGVVGCRNGEPQKISPSDRRGEGLTLRKEEGSKKPPQKHRRGEKGAKCAKPERLCDTIYNILSKTDHKILYVKETYAGNTRDTAATGGRASGETDVTGDLPNSVLDQKGNLRHHLGSEKHCKKKQCAGLAGTEDTAQEQRLGCQSCAIRTVTKE